MRESFVIHTAYAEKFKRLTDEQFGMLVRLLIQYQLTGEINTISDATVAFAFDIARVDMDITNQRYQEVCEKRRIAGSMGGQAKQANASKSKQKLANGSKTSKTYHKRREDKIFSHENKGARDAKRYKAKNQNDKNCSFDADEFFEAAVRKSLERHSITDNR